MGGERLVRRPAPPMVLAVAALLLGACGGETAPPDPAELLAGAPTRGWTVRAPEGEQPAVSSREQAVSEPIWLVPEGAGDGPWLASVQAETLAGEAAVIVEGWDATERAGGAAWWRARPRALPPPRIGVVPRSEQARVRLRVTAHRPPPAADVDHSLAWTDPTLLDDASAVGLARVMGAAAGDGHGGRLLDHWLRRFARTAHSERPALADLADALAARFGADPALWPMDELPFRVTGVHNRLDLRTDGHCGELRVSMACTDPDFGPIHLLFVFAQPVRAADRAVTGTAHCTATALSWARLAALEREAFLARARDLLDARLRPEAFVMMESLERTVGSWEWRQWRPRPGTELPALSNPPLLQTLDVEALNLEGPRREALFEWIAEDPDAVLARRARVPEALSAPSARAREGVPRPELDLSGLPGALRDRAPALREALDTIGCPGCHARAPSFVQTGLDRTFSPFYERELEARRRALDAFGEGTAERPPFGALQDP